MIPRLKKIISIVLIVQLLFLSPVPLVRAQEVTSAPTPSPEVSTQSPATTDSPTPASDINTTSPTPADTSGNASQIQQTAENPNTTPTSSTTAATNSVQQNQLNPVTDRDAYKAEQERLAILAWENAHPQLAALAHESGKLGDSAVATGDSSSTGALVSTGNNNFAENSGSGPSASLINSGNGASSSNNGSATILNDKNTNQNNSANVLSGLHGDSKTGNNNASFNVGNSDLVTGDANSTGTIISALNTNVDGVMVSEFNIVDDHVGDIVLDFGANCISGCGPSTGSGLNVANSGNGADSTNDANAQITNNKNTFQNNDGTVGNQLVLSADSGNNKSSFNTGGNSNIKTGDANVAANALTFLNNNLSGNVVYSVVNIFGNLIGDIIFPEGQLNCCGASNVSAVNNGNGAFSDNTANGSLTNNSTMFQANDANINNNLVFDAQTGNNTTSFNTGGNSTASTGNANVDANVLNILNNNITGGNMWLVLINQAGNWVGKLMGAAPGATYAGSEGLEFNIGNLGNGAGSTNNAGTSVTTNTSTTQNNNAAVNNTLNLSVNTGGNASSFNTGGDSNIQTGNANIIANLVNFVNNNISGGGKLFVTVVNVFGSWAGNFYGPGQHKEKSESQNSKSETSSNTAAANANVQNSNSSNNNNTNNSITNNQQQASKPLSNTLSGALNILSNFSHSNPSHSSTSSTPSSGAGLLASTDVKVAGVKTDKNTMPKEKKIKINLAWLVIIIPTLLLVVALRRMIMRRVK